MPSDELAVLIQPYLAEITAIRERREAELDAQMAMLSASVASRSFRFDLERKQRPNGKAVYPSSNSAEAYFVSRHLQRNIANLYQIKPANRRVVVQQLRDVLTGGMSLYLVKSDIKDFFESIPNSSLMKKIVDDQLLSNTSRHHVRTALESYKSLSQSQLGVPRGLGISSYLAELYMRSADEQIRAMKNIIFYARYVDDIVAVFAPEPGQAVSQFLKDVKAVIVNEQLAPNPAKTSGYSIERATTTRFEFLGYGFAVQSSTCELSISAAKVLKMKSRIDATISAYEDEKERNPKLAFRLCVARMEFLSSNTRLTNNKGNIYTGIYYNNSLASEISGIRSIDNYYQVKIRTLSSVKLIQALSQLSFESGFLNRRFCRSSSRKLAKMTEAWS
jgi:hypothetical protein